MNILKKSTIERPTVFGEGDTLFRYDYAAKLSKGKMVLDIGMGLGDGANHMILHQAKKVVAIDNDRDAVAYAKKKFRRRNLHFVQMDALNMKFPKNHFDIIVAFEVIEHLPIASQEDFLLEIKRVLKRNGKVLLSTPNRLINSPGVDKPNNPFHTKEYSPKEFELILKKRYRKVDVLGLKITNNEYLKRYRDNGKKFRYRIFDIIGRSKTIRTMAGYIPKRTRTQLTGEYNMPTLTLENFTLYNDRKRNKAETLFAICAV